MNMRLDEFKSETFSSIDMNLSTINSNKYPYSYDQPSANLIKWSLLKSPGKTPMHHNSPNIYISWPSKAVPLFRFKNGGMTSLLTSANIYQQKRAGHHTNTSEHNITTSLPLSSHQSYILNISQKKQVMDHSQEQSEFILLKITPFHHKEQQNCMSNSLYK